MCRETQNSYYLSYGQQFQDVGGLVFVVLSLWYIWLDEEIKLLISQAGTYFNHMADWLVWDWLPYVF